MDCPPEEQVLVLRWLADRQRAPLVTPLGDRDLAGDLGWTQEKAQSMLAGLRARGDIVCKDILLEGGGGYAMGGILFTAAGLHRLEAEDRASQPAVPLLRRLAMLVAPRGRR